MVTFESIMNLLEIRDEAGICADKGLEIYTDEGQIIIQEQEVDYDGE